MLRRLLSAAVLWVGAWSACTTLTNGLFNLTNLTAGVVVNWTNPNSTLDFCGNKSMALGGGARLINNASLYQTVNLTAGITHTIDCDFYDYEYGSLSILNGAFPAGAVNFPKIVFVAGGGFRKVIRNFTSTATTTVLIRGQRVCIQSCVLTPVICTVAPTTKVPTTRVPTTRVPTRVPTVPSMKPTTAAPSLAPSRLPTQAPTLEPTQLPTLQPTVSPTLSPTASPTTLAPSLAPTTRAPTRAPSLAPTTRVPTRVPTRAPTRAPTMTLAPTLPPLARPTIVVTQILNSQIAVIVNSSSLPPYVTRCIAHTGLAYTNVSAFWSYSTPWVLNSSVLPFTFVFSGLLSGTTYAIDCGSSNGLNGNLSTVTASTQPRCSDGPDCAEGSQCLDTNDGTIYICAPFIAGVSLAGSSSLCPRGGQPLQTNLSSADGGDRIGLCLGVGNNTNASAFSSSLQVFYGINSSLSAYSCSALSFGPVVAGWMRVNCTTAPGVGSRLIPSLQFAPANSAMTARLTTLDTVGYPLVQIFPNTSRFTYLPGGWTDTLVSLTTDPVWISFSVSNIAPSSPLLRIFYGPPANYLQRECALDRGQSNATTVVCLTDSSTVYNAVPYNWTILAGDVFVTGTDTFDLSANSPRVESIACSRCSTGPGGRLFKCPTIGSTPSSLVILTVVGFNFGLNYTVRVYVDGNNCPVLNSTPGANASFPDSISCLLPSGTGYNRSVFMQTAGQFSSPLPLLSYDTPNITRICGCDTNCQANLTNIGQCNRAGGDTIEVYGTSFGTQNSAILVGSTSCTNVIHDSFSPDTHLTCRLPSGSALGSSLIVIQQNGPNSASGAPAMVSYRMCMPGTIQVGSLTSCADCASGTYAPLEGLLACLPCPPGSISFNATASSCSACDVGKYQLLSNQTTCMNCSVGMFAGTTGLSACLGCSPGTHMNNTGASLCDPCEPGYHSNSSQSAQCDPCGVGTLAAVSNQKDCTACAPGSYNDHVGQSICVECAPGSYAPSSQASICTLCEPGTIAAGDAQKLCESCLPGTFANGTGQFDCVNCAPGRYAPSGQASACTLCENGTIADREAQKVCMACLPGTFANSSGLSHCSSCGFGEYLVLSGQTKCLACEPGRFSNELAQPQCTNCLQGSFANESGATICMGCVVGFFQAALGGSSCESCPSGFISSEDNTACTICPPGSHANNLTCTQCVAGRFQSSPGQLTCTPCGPGTAVAIEGAKECPLCEEGLVAPRSGLLKCQSCPPGAAQAGTPPSCACRPGYYMTAALTQCVECKEGMQCTEYGLREDGVLPRVGYLKVENSSMFLACLVEAYCPGGLTRCAPFREGPLCNMCVQDYRPVQGEAGCGPCPTQSLSAAYIFLIAALILAALTLLYAFVIRSDIHILAVPSTSKQRQWWQESEKEDPLDRRTSLVVSGEEDPDLEPVSPAAPLKKEVRVKKTLSYQFKIFITFLQLITALLALSAVNWPPTFQAFIANFDFVNLSFLPWNYVGCLTRLRLFDKILLTSCFPPLLLIAIGGPLLAVLWCLDKRDDADLELNRVKRAQAKNIFWRVIVFTIFLSYPAVSRQIISYFRCVPVPGGETTIYYMRDSFWELCYDSTWFNLLGPVIVAVLIYPVGIPLALLYALLHNRNKFRSPAVLYSLGLAYSGFHPEFWWFELLDMLHKLVLGCLLALLPDRSVQIAVALAVSAAYALVLFISAPYLRDSDNQLHLLSQVEVFLLVLSMQSGGEVAGVSSGSLTDVLVSGVLIVMVVVVFVVFMFVTIRYLRLGYLRKLQKKRQRMLQRSASLPQLSSHFSRTQTSFEERSGTSAQTLQLANSKPFSSSSSSSTEKRPNNPPKTERPDNPGSESAPVMHPSPQVTEVPESHLLQQLYAEIEAE